MANPGDTSVNRMIPRRPTNDAWGAVANGLDVAADGKIVGLF
jgi:hypothetical protein